MSVIDSLLSYLIPFDCLGCGTEGDLLCANCLEAQPSFPGRCYRCHKVFAGNSTCPPCLQAGGLYRVGVAVVYQGAAKDLIWSLKSNGAQAAASIMARRMRQQMLPGKYLVVPIPTATSRVRQRGYNQAALVARQLAKQAKLPLARGLVRQGQAHQVGASRDQRLNQLKGAFRVVQPKLVRGQNILLVDDVLTTGVTLEAAAQALRQAGAARVEGITFAQALMRKAPA